MHSGGIGIVFTIYFLYNYYKNTIVDGKRLIDKVVNSSTRTDKMGIGELLKYALMFAIAIFSTIKILYWGANFPSATSALIKLVILAPIMALFNARRRTRKDVFVLVGSLLFLFFCEIAYITIGLPVKAPVLAINNTEMRLGHTTVQELMNDGFDIYVEKERTYAMDYDDFPDSDKFVKYSGAMDISIPGGYHRYGQVPYCVGVLAKNDQPIAIVTFYGSMSEEKPLKDCSIILFNLWSRFISEIRNSGITLKLNGVDLLATIKTETMKETFGNKIFRRYPRRYEIEEEIETEKRYIISWESNSHHLFYNSYFATIRMNDNHLMNSLELECQIAREADE